MGVLALILVLLAASASGVRAADCDLPLGRVARVARAIDGETLVLEGGGEVRLLGVMAPRTPPWWRGPGPWPAAQAATRALARLAEGHDVALHFDQVAKDRRGRELAQVFLTQEGARLWLQGDLVGQGHARAYSFAENRACAQALLGLEAAARGASKGLWGRRAYSVLPAGEPGRITQALQTFQIVEGRVTATGRSQRWVFLNFGDDWHQDFTIAIDTKTTAAFNKAGLDLKALQGGRLRVRGWIERWNGPAIRVTGLEQIEVLERPPAAPLQTGGGSPGKPVAGQKETPAPMAPGRD